MKLSELFINKAEVEEGDVVDMHTPMPAEFINWLKTKNLTMDVLNDRVKMRKLRLQYEQETGTKLGESSELNQALQMYADNTQMRQAIIKAFQKSNIQTVDQAIDVAQAELRRQQQTDQQDRRSGKSKDDDPFKKSDDQKPKKGSRGWSDRTHGHLRTRGDDGTFNPVSNLGKAIARSRGAEFAKKFDPSLDFGKGSGAQSRSRYVK